MLIGHLEAPSPHLQGDQIYRTVQPCGALAAFGQQAEGPAPRRVVSGNWLSPWMHAVAQSADILVLCQSFDVDFLALLAQRRAHGQATIVEINDNFLAAQPFNPVAAFYAQPHIRSLIVQLASLADGLQTCSPGLAQRFARLNAHHIILKNQLDAPPKLRHRFQAQQNSTARAAPPLQTQAKPRPAPSPRPHVGAPAKPQPGTAGATAASGDPASLTLGWAGSLGHRDDVAWMLPALQHLLAAHPSLRLAIMAPMALHPLFANLDPKRLQLSPAADLAGYKNFLQQVDIGLAPLLPTEFNACRSDVKYLEYSAAGALTLASRQPGYTDCIEDGVNGHLFTERAELIAKVEDLLKHPQKRQTIATTAHQQVSNSRQEAQHSPRRWQWYLDCWQRAQARTRAPAQAHPHAPDQASTHAPDQTCPPAPAQARPHAPDQASTHAPDQARPHAPDQARARAPALADLPRQASSPKSVQVRFNAQSQALRIAGSVSDRAGPQVPTGATPPDLDAQSAPLQTFRTATNAALQSASGRLSRENYLQGSMGPLEQQLYTLLEGGPSGRAAFTQAEALAPDFYLIHLYAAQVGDGRAALLRATKAAPGSAAAWLALGNLLLPQEPRLAAQAYRQAVQQSPQLAPAYEGLGRVCLAMQQPRAALPHLRRAIAANPAYRPAATRLAIILRDRGEWTAAAEILEAGISGDLPPNWLDALLLGDLYVAQNKLAAAQSCLKLAQNLAPASPEVQASLSRLNQAQDQAQDQATPNRNLNH